MTPVETLRFILFVIFVIIKEKIALFDAIYTFCVIYMYILIYIFPFLLFLYIYEY